MEFLAQRLDFNAFLLDLRLLLPVDTGSTILPSGVPLLRHTNRHVEVGDLVGVLARSRHLDRASPVEVEMAERVGQRLQVDLLQRGLVQGYVEMRGQYATLVGS